MISASHNPALDNGIKFFGGDGYKLEDEKELEIEALIDAKEDTLPRPSAQGLGMLHDYIEGVRKYQAFLKQRLKVTLKVIMWCLTLRMVLHIPQHVPFLRI